VSDWIRQNVSVPFIIIRPDAVRNTRMRIGTLEQGAAAAEDGAISPVPTPADTGRKVALAYPNFAAGRGLMEVAKRVILEPNDTVYVMHVFKRESKAVVQAAQAMVRETRKVGLWWVGRRVLGGRGWGANNSRPGGHLQCLMFL
jgi:hypothetical protein